jgi:hypothetical protein
MKPLPEEDVMCGAVAEDDTEGLYVCWLPPGHENGHTWERPAEVQPETVRLGIPCPACGTPLTPDMRCINCEKTG